MTKTIAYVGSMGLPAKYGGFETAIFNITKKLKSQYRLIVFSVDPDNYYFSNNIITPKILQIGIPTFDRILRELIPLFLLLSKFKADVVHVHGPFISAPLYAFFNIKIIQSTDGIEWKRESYDVVTRMFVYLGYYIGSLFSNKVTFDAIFVKDYYKKHFKIQGDFIPYGPLEDCSIDHSHPVPFGLKPDDYLLFAGRLVPEKGVEDLILTFNMLIKESKVAKKLVILGNDVFDGKYKKYLISLADPEILFLPSQYNCNYETLVKNAYAIVRPSIDNSEGLNPTLVEAMNWNGFIILSKVSQNQEITDGKFIYFEPNNLEEFRESLEKTLEFDSSIKEDFKTHNQLIIQNRYEWEVISSKFAKLYDNIIQN